MFRGNYLQVNVAIRGQIPGNYRGIGNNLFDRQVFSSLKKWLIFLPAKKNVLTVMVAQQEKRQRNKPAPIVRCAIKVPCQRESEKE